MKKKIPFLLFSRTGIISQSLSGSVNENFYFAGLFQEEFSKIGLFVMSQREADTQQPLAAARHYWLSQRQEGMRSRAPCVLFFFWFWSSLQGHFFPQKAANTGLTHLLAGRSRAVFLNWWSLRIHFLFSKSKSPPTFIPQHSNLFHKNENAGPLSIMK